MCSPLGPTFASSSASQFSTYTTLPEPSPEDSRIITKRWSPGATSYCCRFLAPRYPEREKSGRGVPDANGGPEPIWTAINWLPLLKNSSRPLRAQRGSVPPSRETRWVEVIPGKGRDVDLVSPRRVRAVGEPVPVRREGHIGGAALVDHQRYQGGVALQPPPAEIGLARPLRRTGPPATDRPARSPPPTARRCDAAAAGPGRCRPRASGRCRCRPRPPPAAPDWR